MIHRWAVRLDAARQAAVAELRMGVRSGLVSRGQGSVVQRRRKRKQQSIDMGDEPVRAGAESAYRAGGPDYARYRSRWTCSGDHRC